MTGMGMFARPGLQIRTRLQNDVVVQDTPIAESGHTSTVGKTASRKEVKYS
jgi:hypothetical protein